jgi:hypothetical protein
MFPRNGAVLASGYAIEEPIITDIPEINPGKAQTCTLAFCRNLGLPVIDNGGGETDH